MLTRSEQDTLARALRILRREANREPYATDHNKVRVALRAGDAKDALVEYVITAKIYVGDDGARRVWDRDTGSPVEPEPAQLDLVR